MAYKFQLGAAKLGGSLTTEDITTDADGVISGSIGRFTHLSCSANSIVIGSTTLSESELGIVDGFADTAIAQAADSIVFFDADTSKLRRDSVSDVMTAVAGDGLNVASSQLQINTRDQNGLDIDGSGRLRIKLDSSAGLELDASGIQIKAAGVVNSMLADDAVGADELAANAVVEASIVDNAVTLAKMAGLARGSVIVGDASGDPSALAKGTAGQFAVSDGDDIIYRSMSGDATLAANGALTIGAQKVVNSMLADDAVGADELAANAVVEASIVDNAVSLAKMAGIARGSIIIGDASGDPSALAKGAAHTFLQSDGTDTAYVALSGDATLNAGAITIADNAVSLAKMAGIARGSIIVGDASGDPSALAKGTAGQFAVSDGDDIIYRSLSGDATLAANGALTIGAQKVVNSMLADDAVGADELASNAVVNDSVASNAAIAANKLNFNVDLGGDITFGSQSDDTISTAGHLTVGGNLTVNGSVTSVNSTTINITSSFTFEGPADDHETVLSSGSPAADSTLTLPTLSAGSYFLPALADAATDASAAVTAAEFALLDGASSIGSTALAAGDGFLHNDGGTMKQTTIGKISDFLVSDGLTQNAGKGIEVSLNTLGATKTSAIDADSLAMIDSAGSNVTKKITVANFKTKMDLLEVEEGPATNLVVGVNFFDDFGAAASFSRNLPASPAVGDSVMVKAPSDCGVNKTITIAKQGSHTIDGATSILLESPHAAVQCVYVKANLWKVF